MESEEPPLQSGDLGLLEGLYAAKDKGKNLGEYIKIGG